MVLILQNSRLTMFCDPCLSSFTKRAELATFTNVDIRSLWQSSSKLRSAHLAYREYLNICSFYAFRGQWVPTKHLHASSLTVFTLKILTCESSII